MTSKRLTELQLFLHNNDIHCALLFYSRDIYYYTGTAHPSYLVVTPHDFRLFVRQGLEAAKRETFIPSGKLDRSRGLREICSVMVPKANERLKLGTELDILPMSWSSEYTNAFHGMELVDISPKILAQRMVKSDAEVKLIERACQVAHAGYDSVRRLPLEGCTELEFAATVENAQRLAGHEGVTFFRRHDVLMGRGSFASGSNIHHSSGALMTITGTGLSPALPVGASLRRIGKQELILVDISTCVKGYHSDQTRMFVFGEVPRKAADLHLSLRAIADHILESMRPGQSAGDAYEFALKAARGMGVEKYFLFLPSGKRAHFVGHGVGLELNEPPLLSKSSREILLPGMVLALEMHILEKGGLGVKLEDTILLTDKGGKLLTRTPREIVPLN